jgi:serine/threonine-protein kinase
MSPDRWQAVSPYLDQALAMPEPERAVWLTALRASNPALAAELQTLLREHRALADSPFLEDSPTSLSSHPVVECHRALAGQMVGAYKLLSPLGQGGMGTVWLAERSDGRFEGRAAVKFLSIALLNRAGEERFKREGSILSRLTHPNIARLLDAGVSTSGQPYLVLEHVDGEPIDQYCDHQRLDVEARVRLFLDVLAAVAQAHANLIVHRDLKPSNVLVGTGGRVKLLDFGIAKLIEAEGETGTTQLTREGGWALTPLCAAPEQVTGEAVTTATDVYGLGVLLYSLLSGHHPAGSSLRSPADLIKAIVDGQPLPMSEVVARTGTDPEVAGRNAANRGTTPEKLRRLLKGDLDTIVAKALKKNPVERYASVSALAEDLRRYLSQEPIRVRPDSIAYRAAKFVRRNRKAVALATVALAATIAGVVGTLIQARTARVQRDFAYRQLSRAEAINDLNEFILSDAAPSGKPFTVKELLGRAERIVERQQGANDVNRAESLVSIGRFYQTFDDDADGRRLLGEAYDYSRKLSEPSIRARASCSLASALSRGQDQPRAEKLIKEGLDELPTQPQFLLDREFCLARGSEVARDRGDSNEAIARSQARMQLLKMSPIQSDVVELSTLMSLADSYRVAGRLEEASTTFEQAFARLTSLGRDQTRQAATLFNNWAVALTILGRALEAEKIFKRALQIEREGGTDENVSPMLLINYGRALRELGRLGEAEDFVERGYARAQKFGYEVVIIQASFLKAGIYRARRDFTRAESTLSELEPRLRRAYPTGHIVFAVLAAERALIAEARGELKTSLDQTNQAMALAEESVKEGRQGADYLPIFLVRRSNLLRQLDRAEEAATDADRALKLLQKTQGGATLGRAHLALGRALAAQGKRAQASAELRPALEQLQNSLGPDSPDTRSARELVEADNH